MLNHRLVATCIAFAAAAHGQWLNYAAPGTPLSKDGTPNLTAQAPRAADGKPDLSGVWMHELTPAAEVRRLFGPNIDEAIKVDVPGMEIGTQHKYVFDIFLDVQNKEGLIRPAAQEKMRRMRAERNPASVCVGTAGIPMAALLSEPIKIVQAQRMTIILHESDGSHRQIYTDGRKFPKEFELPAWLGYSIGHWEGDTLLVETAGFNDRAPLDGVGRPHSENLKVTERYHRRDFGHMDVETTFDDPEMYARPFTIKVPFNLLADQDVFESFCTENEKDRAHLEKK